MKIGVVIVTYNRLDKLKKALECFETQTKSPMFICVVDNHSTDGTSNYLKEWANGAVNKYVLTLEENQGGSGGFFYGIEYARTLGADWLWLSDDDAYPRQDAFDNAYCFLERRRNEDISAISAKVLNHKGIDYTHRSNYLVKGLKIIHTLSRESEYKKECFSINAFSYVGTVINVSKIEDIGSTKKDYFIWFDDTEHSIRLSKVGQIYCVPSVVVYHDVLEELNTYSWKSYYGIRNCLDMYRSVFPFYCYIYYATKKIGMAALYSIFGAKAFGTDEEYVRLFKTAIHDALTHKLGIHNIYKPGWKPKRDS